MEPYTAVVRRVCTQGARAFLVPTPLDQDVLRDRSACYFAAWMNHYVNEWGLSLESGFVLPLKLQAALLIRNTGLRMTSCYRALLPPGASSLVDRVPLVSERPCVVPNFPECWDLYSEIVNEVLPAYTLDTHGVRVIVAGGAARAYHDGMLPWGTRDLDVWVVKAAHMDMTRAEERDANGKLRAIMDALQKDICLKLEQAEVKEYDCHENPVSSFRVTHICVGDDWKVDLIPVIAQALYVGDVYDPDWYRVARALLGSFDMPSARVAYYTDHGTHTLYMGNRGEAHFPGCTNKKHTECTRRRARYATLMPFCTRYLYPDGSEDSAACYDPKESLREVVVEESPLCKVIYM